MYDTKSFLFTKSYIKCRFVTPFVYAEPPFREPFVYMKPCYVNADICQPYTDWKFCSRNSSFCCSLGV